MSIPQENNRLHSVRLFLWDPRTKKCMGRTGESWLKIIAFYIVLYIVLAALWSVFFLIFQQTISDRYPKWQLDESLIGTNPGLGFRPQNPPSRADSALISFKIGVDGDYGYWINDLSNYMMNFKGRNVTLKEDCGLDRDLDAYCPFDSSEIPPECTLAQNYSFSIGKPCILVKINRIYGWRPQPFEKKPANFPSEVTFIPNNIHITCEGQVSLINLLFRVSSIYFRSQLITVWSQQPTQHTFQSLQNDFDKEHIGPLEYYPRSIEPKYYPFYNQRGYQSPFVMVQFKSPKYNTLIYVECKAWAKNIEHDRANKRGLTSFELFIERPTTKNQTKQ